MRRLLELSEEVDEVNYFLKEWQTLKAQKSSHKAVLEEPELRFISRNLERIIDEAQKLDSPLALKSNSSRVKHIKLTKYLKIKSNGKKISYVGNKDGLLSLNRIAEMVSSGGELSLSVSLVERPNARHSGLASRN